VPVRIRSAKPAADELAAIAQLRYDAFFEGSDRSLEQDRGELETFVRDQGYEVALVAECDGRLAGTCLFVRDEIEPQHDVSPWLAGLVVAPEFRGRGVGSMLVQAIEAHARSAGCPVIHLYTYGAEGFYAALGWSVVERFQDCGEPAVLMSKDLSLAE
jgi:GNAT superfamily N-acetyltransferase